MSLVNLFLFMSLVYKLYRLFIHVLCSFMFYVHSCFCISLFCLPIPEHIFISIHICLHVIIFKFLDGEIGNHLLEIRSTCRSSQCHFYRHISIPFTFLYYIPYYIPIFRVVYYNIVLGRTSSLHRCPIPHSILVAPPCCDHVKNTTKP